MFFIMGSPRSGTTLLATTLDQHSSLVVPGETDFIVPLCLLVNRYADPSRGRRAIVDLVTGSRDAPSVLRHLPAQDVDETVHSVGYTAAAIVHALYARLAEHAGARRAGDKSPNDLANVHVMLRAGLFSDDVHVVHVVRDLRDVMPSLLRAPWAPSDVEQFFPRLWAYSNTHLHEQMRGRRNYLLVRFEDFAHEPEATVEALCRFLGVDPEPGMLDPDKRDRAGRDDQPLLSEQVSSSRAQAWRTSPPTGTQQWTEVAREALALFGYM